MVQRRLILFVFAVALSLGSSLGTRWACMARTQRRADRTHFPCKKISELFCLFARQARQGKARQGKGKQWQPDKQVANALQHQPPSASLLVRLPSCSSLRSTATSFLWSLQVQPRSLSFTRNMNSSTCAFEEKDFDHLQPPDAAAAAASSRTSGGQESERMDGLGERGKRSAHKAVTAAAQPQHIQAATQTPGENGTTSRGPPEAHETATSFMPQMNT